MSLYLALDTATALGSVALGGAGGVVAEVTVGDRRHAAATLPAMEDGLRLAGARLAEETAAFVDAVHAHGRG